MRYTSLYNLPHQNIPHPYATCHNHITYHFIFAQLSHVFITHHRSAWGYNLKPKYSFNSRRQANFNFLFLRPNLKLNTDTSCKTSVKYKHPAMKTMCPSLWELLDKTIDLESRSWLLIPDGRFHSSTHANSLSITLLLVLNSLCADSQYQWRVEERGAKGHPNGERKIR